MARRFARHSGLISKEKTMQRKLLTIPIIALLSFVPAAQAQQSVSKQAQ